MLLGGRCHVGEFYLSIPRNDGSMNLKISMTQGDRRRGRSGQKLFILGQCKNAVLPLEPIPKDVDSDESVVIHYRAPGTLAWGVRCGSLNIAPPPSVAA